MRNIARFDVPRILINKQPEVKGIMTFELRKKSGKICGSYQKKFVRRRKYGCWYHKLVTYGNGCCVAVTVAPPQHGRIRQEYLGEPCFRLSHEICGRGMGCSWQRIGGTYASSKIAGTGRHGTTFFVRTPLMCN